MAPTEMKKADKDDDACTSSTSKEATTKITPIGSFGSIDEFTKSGLAEIVNATRTVNALPQGRARDLYCAYPTFGRIVDEQSDRILGIISKVLKWQNINGNIQRRQQDEQFEMLQECNDGILERLNINLDELAGIKKAPSAVVIESQLNAVFAGGSIVSAGEGAGSWNVKKTGGNPLTARLITAKYIARPQNKFKIAVDNNALTPFMPKLKEKPNSRKPLAILPEYDDFGNITSYLHPYEFELMKFEVPDVQLTRRSPKIPSPVDATELVYVSSVVELKLALEDLRKHKEIAVDVEHHSYRTFLGITCLIQISTRNKDYIFDALELREELHVLNEVFTDPSVVKIFHGADMDIKWLQRDLSLYVVNMFDTHQAAKALKLARLSLAFLLKHYCQIEADKTFQLSDWRIRPLPAQLLAYARQDTHFLIYIFERITNDLLDVANQQSNVLGSVYQLSTQLCKKRYFKPLLDATSHMDLLHKSKRIFDNRQLFAFTELFQWRDLIAREEDESCGYVLPNHMLLQISESLPREMQGILACCNPIPPLVRQHLHALHQIVLRAREQPLVKPVLETDSTPRVANSGVRDYNNKLYCPHDLSHITEFRDDLPTLLDSKGAVTNESQEVQERLVKKPTFTVFETSAWSEEVADIRMQRLLPGCRVLSAITPYQRWLAVLPYAEQEKRAEAVRIEAELSKRKLCPGDSTTESSANQNVKREQTDYTLPTKEPHKRKHEESTNATKPTTSETPPSKRIKTETPTKNNKSRALKSEPKGTKKTAANGSQGDVIVVSDDSDGPPPDEKPSTSRAHQSQKQQQKQQPQKQQQKQQPQKQQQKQHPPQQRHNQRPFKRNYNRNKGKFQQHNQSSNNPVTATGHFDFKNVDAKQFRGGAQRSKGTELKPQFHGKGNSNKANNKKFNKLFTFSNVKEEKFKSRRF